MQSIYPICLAKEPMLMCKTSRSFNKERCSEHAAHRKRFVVIRHVRVAGKVHDPRICCIDANVIDFILARGLLGSNFRFRPVTNTSTNSVLRPLNDPSMTKRITRGANFLHERNGLARRYTVYTRYLVHTCQHRYTRM